MAKLGKTIHEGNALNRDYMLVMIPLFLMALFFYGPRVLLLGLVAVVTARLCDRLAAMLRSRRYDRTENSSLVMALVIVLMLPANVRYRVVVAAVVVAVLVGKEAFGGYNCYPFNPSAVGYCVAAVSWPDDVMRYPAPTNWVVDPPQTWETMLRLWNFTDAPLLAGPAATLKSGGLPKIDFWSLVLGNYPSPLGIACSVVILSCVLYLLAKKRFSLYAPALYFIVIALIAFIFPRYTEIGFATWPQDIMVRLQVVKFELLSGGVVFAGVFMINEPCTLPKNRLSQVIYGGLLGIATMMFRYFGTYEMGACFAILLVNAISGYFDRAIASYSARRKGAALT